MQRRLAAILAADVVGYSRLMGADETGPLSRLKTHRSELIDPAIAARGGRIVKLMGDGALIEFASAVAAVECAVEIQRAMDLRNAGVPEGQRIAFRVGINSGDVIVDGDDIYGDGVNVAARLEGLAEPGGVCISAKVHDEVRDRLELNFQDLGEQEVKNIARPVRIYKVVLSPAVDPGEPRAAALKARLARQPDSDVGRVLLAACYGHLGRVAEARAEWREALRINPDYPIEHRRKIVPYKNPADFERVVDGLRKAGVAV